MLVKKTINLTTLVATCVIYSSFSHSATSPTDENILSNLLISETSVTGTMINKGRAMYMKKFTISIINTGKQSIDLAKGCYYATNEDDSIKVKPKIFDPSLRSKITPKTNNNRITGDIEFVSFDKEIYKFDFVKWTSNCKFMTEANILAQ